MKLRLRQKMKIFWNIFFEGNVIAAKAENVSVLE